MSGKKQWTVEECSNLIEVYREHPNLWNSSHIEYKNRIKKYDSLKEIAAMFGTKCEEVERKIKNIYSQYLRERRNYKKLKKSGAGHTFKAKWFGYAAMCFLHDKNKPIKGSQRGLDFEDSDSSDSDVDVSESQTSQTENETAEIQQESQEPMEEPLEQYTESPQSTQSQKAEQINNPSQINISNTEKEPGKQHLFSTPTVKKRSKPTGSANTNNVTEEAFSMMKAVFQRTQKEQQGRDEYLMFGELVGHKIRNLKTDFSRATVQHMINTILYDAQIGKYDFPQHSSVVPIPPLTYGYNAYNTSSPYSHSAPSPCSNSAPSPCSNSAPSPYCPTTEMSTADQATTTADILKWAINTCEIDEENR